MQTKDRIYRIKNIISYVRGSHLGKMPKKEIVLSDDKRAKAMIAYFNKRSRKFMGIRRLSTAVALIDLSAYACFEDYRFSIRGKNSADYFKRRCEKKDYHFKSIDRNDYIDEIHAINNSLEERCGAKMGSAYSKKIQHYENENILAYGVFTGDKLVAYADLSISNELVKINRILGHGEYLTDNIVYLLMFSIIEELVILSKTSEIKYFMYDSFWGNPRGLVLFKNRFKFLAYNINWKLK
jgi:hypothetical protein